MTLKTGANRSFNPYKTGFLSCPLLIPQPLIKGNNLVNPGHQIVLFCGKVISNPPKCLNFPTDSVTIIGLKITQNSILASTNRVRAFLCMVHHLLLSVLLYIGVFLNHMHLKSAISSRTQVRHLDNNRFFNSPQVVSIPGAFTIQLHCHEERVGIMSWSIALPCFNDGVRSKQIWSGGYKIRRGRVLLITEESII